MTKIVSVKIPDRVLQHMPSAGKGRSRFIIAALEEKIFRQNGLNWKPQGKRGQRLAALLKRGAMERAPLLDEKGIVAELAERRGQFH